MKIKNVDYEFLAPELYSDKYPEKHKTLSYSVGLVLL